MANKNCGAFYFLAACGGICIVLIVLMATALMVGATEVSSTRDGQTYFVPGNVSGDGKRTWGYSLS